MLFPQGTWLTEELKTLKGGVRTVGNQQAEVRIALASVPIIAAERPKEAALRCDQHGMFMDCGFCTMSENEKRWSASGG